MVFEISLLHLCLEVLKTVKCSGLQIYWSKRIWRDKGVNTIIFLNTILLFFVLVKIVWYDKSVVTIFYASALITYSMSGVYVNTTSCLSVMIAYDKGCQSARVKAICVLFENATLLLWCLQNNVLWYFGSRLSSILALESRHDLFSSLSLQDLMMSCCLGCLGNEAWYCLLTGNGE